MCQPSDGSVPLIADDGIKEKSTAERETAMDSGTSKIVVVTGASRGLGQATAREIAKRGHTVVATMRNPNDFAAFKDAEGTFDFERMDVTDPENVKAALGSVEARHGQIDVLINNAAAGLWGALEDVSEEEMTTLFDTNMMGTWRTCLAVLPGMRKRRSGRIINTVSFVRTPWPWIGPYFATKAAIWHLSGALAFEVEQFGVEVSVVVPGGYQTDWQTESLWVAERSTNGNSAYSAQTQKALDAFRVLRNDWPGPDHYGERVAALVDTPEIPFLTTVAREDFQEMLATTANMTLEEQGAVWRDALPGVMP